ncbi:TatD family hydrolase [Candidatus Nomurabacteria bacterium]|nr:TatD family hydrolase [Candidatus Nomurabacteria bacterium]
MEPKYIDIHSHTNFIAFDADRDEVIRRSLDNDTWVINVGTQVDTSKKAVEMAHQYEKGVYAIIGLHPIHTGASFHDKKELGEEGKEFTSRGEMFNKNTYRELLKDKKVVAIGECGLDYYRMDEESITKQKNAFIEQIELANEFNKPLMLHIRNNPEDKTCNAYFDSLEILKQHLNSKSLPAGRRGDVHFFAGNLEEAKAFLDFGFTLSFTGVITFASSYDEVIKNTPLDMIMSETDAPYVTPAPHRGKRNEPYYVKEVVKKIALIKNLPEEEVAQALVANAKRVFGI